MIDKIQCKICGMKYKHLGSHLWHTHKILARDYKERFGLPYNYSLISETVKEKKHDHWEENKDKYIKNLTKVGSKYQFKKGRTGQRRISQKERETILKRILEVNKNRKPEQCPVCKMIFKNVNSHLYNAHKLLKINI